jgi:hypothetical protein
MIKGEIMKKFWVKVLACLLMVTVLLSGCKTLEPETITVRPEIELIEGVTYSNEIGEFDASSNTESIEIYNKNLFYRNGLMPYNADPGVFYCNDETDKENYGVIYAPLPETKGIGLALYNRMIRAAAHNIIRL